MYVSEGSCWRFGPDELNLPVRVPNWCQEACILPVFGFIIFKNFSPKEFNCLAKSLYSLKSLTILNLSAFKAITDFPKDSFSSWLFLSIVLHLTPIIVNNGIIC